MTGIAEMGVAVMCIDGTRRTTEEVIAEVVADKQVVALYADSGGISPWAHFILVKDRGSFLPITSEEWDTVASCDTMHLSGRTICCARQNTCVLCHV